MNVIVIMAHPNIEKSNVNKVWYEYLVENNVRVHDIYKNYPNFIIDVSKEQSLLEQYQTVVFQFPIYWYSYPPLLKKWFDDVFTHGWAYGRTGDKLKGKKFAAAVSAGDKKENYTHTGGITFTMDEILAPLKATAIHTHAIYVSTFASFGASYGLELPNINESSVNYLKFINSL